MITKHHIWICMFNAISLSGAVVRAETLPRRPDIDTVHAIAKCELQPLAGERESTNRGSSAESYAVQSPAEGLLANYERRELKSVRMEPEVDRNDPWIRLLIVGPKRPLVIDVAVFIGGKGFREPREAWIDEALAARESADQEAKIAIEATTGNDASSSVGPGPSGAASDDLSAPEQTDPKGDGNMTGVTVQLRQVPTMHERLLNYLAISGPNVDRDEIRWLIAEWGSGPDVVLLDSALSWQRAGLATLETCLDGNADGVLSAAEIAQADETLDRADLDANQVVDVSELRRVNRRSAAIPFAIGHSLVVVLDASTDWESLSATISRVYAGNSDETPILASSSAPIKERVARGDSTLDADALRKLSKELADVTIRVDLAAAEDESNGVSVVAASLEFANAADAVIATENVITIDLGVDYVEFAAAQRPNSSLQAAETQVGVGAVIDGNPLWRLLDHDQDERLSRRERQELGRLLTTLDRDGDGQLTAAEMPIPIRVAVTLGPQVHQLLGQPTCAARTIAPRSDVAPPNWFTSMDQNGDRDLSRAEFVGTTEQFRQFDADHDGLLSIAESLKLNADQ